MSHEKVARPFRIRSASEECQCPSCGEPLYVGDRAFQLQDERVVCSPACGQLLAPPATVDYRARTTRNKAS